MYLSICIVREAYRYVVVFDGTNTLRNTWSIFTLSISFETFRLSLFDDFQMLINTNALEVFSKKWNSFFSRKNFE